MYKATKHKVANYSEEQKQKVLQVETVGMMTKYQLVFVKMETAFSKVLNSNKLRDLTQLQKAFYKMKENATEQRK